MQAAHVPSAVVRANAAATVTLAQAQGPLDEPDFCLPRDRAIAIGGGKTVGSGRFERAAGDANAFRASPASDAAVLSLAQALLGDMKLGQGACDRSVDRRCVGHRTPSAMPMVRVATRCVCSSPISIARSVPSSMPWTGPVSTIS